MLRFWWTLGVSDIMVGPYHGFIDISCTIPCCRYLSPSTILHTITLYLPLCHYLPWSSFVDVLPASRARFRLSIMPKSQVQRSKQSQPHKTQNTNTYTYLHLVGLGLGYGLPSNIKEPARTSLRLRELSPIWWSTPEFAEDEMLYARASCVPQQDYAFKDSTNPLDK